MNSKYWIYAAYDAAQAASKIYTFRKLHERSFEWCKNYSK